MEESIGIIYWDHSYNTVLIINLIIVIALFTSLRWLSGILGHANVSDELTKKDNPAFGISLAGIAFAVTIVLAGAVYGDPIYSLEDSIISIGLYSLIGIGLMTTTRLIFDKIAIPHMSIREQIIKGNVAAALIDAGNMIATAIIIRAIMIWVESNTLSGISQVIVGYIISQILLTAATYIWIKRFPAQNNGKELESCFAEGNTALALRFAGRRIGIAFAIAAASSLMVYELYNIHFMLLAWGGLSVAAILLISLLSRIADKIILYNIDVNDEVVNQKNTAIGIIQAVTYISLGLLLAELLV